MLMHGFQIYLYRQAKVSDEDVYAEKQAQKAASTIKIPQGHLSYTKLPTIDYVLYVLPKQLQSQQIY